jgi:hypothetical protein
MWHADPIQSIRDRCTNEVRYAHILRCRSAFDRAAKFFGHSGRDAGTKSYVCKVIGLHPDNGQYETRARII